MILLGMLLSLRFPASPGAAQPARQSDNGAPPHPLQFSGESSVAWVLVPVVVREASGQIRDLRSKDFHLWVDDRPTPIMSFEAGPDAPVRLIYLQDLSGSMANAGKLEASREALRCFLARARGGDEFALMTFASGQTWIDVPFTAATARLEEALSLWQGRGTTALYDAVARLPEARLEDRSLRHAAVLVTDGGDNDSTVEPGAARAIVRRAELPVYVLDLRTHRSPAVAEPASFSHLLRLLAAATGGQYRAIFGPDLGAACAAISEELRYQYVLGFQTRDTGTEAYRPIRVEVAGRVEAGKKPFELSHRQGYHGRSPLESPSSNP